MGLAIPFPAMSGAEPCTGSNRLGKLPSGLMLAEGAIPMVRDARHHRFLNDHFSVRVWKHYPGNLFYHFNAFRHDFFTDTVAGNHGNFMFFIRDLEGLLSLSGGVTSLIRYSVRTTRKLQLTLEGERYVDVNQIDELESVASNSTGRRPAWRVLLTITASCCASLMAITQSGALPKRVRNTCKR